MMALLAIGLAGAVLVFVTTFAQARARQAGGAAAAGASSSGPLELAWRAFERGRLDEAERLAAEQPAAAGAAHLLARVAELRGQRDRAEALYRQAVPKPGLNEAALDFGLFLSAWGRADEASRLLQPFVDAAPSLQTPAELTRAARAARALGEFRLANSLFREAAAGAPQSAAINAAWGDLLLEKHNQAEALKSYQLALEADADYAPAHLGLARALAEDNPPAAGAAAERALALNPALHGASLLKAALALDAGNRDEARRLVDAVLASNPVDLDALALQASIAWVEDRPADYEASMRRALGLNPTWGEGYRVVADHAAGRYRFDDAAALARKATSLDPGNAQAWADLGKHLLRVGDEPGARQALDEAFELDPFNAITFNLLNLLDTLEKFEVIETGSLVVKLHPDEAAVMRDAVTGLARQALEVLSASYGFTPRGPILIEMFPRHDDFAVRNVGLPGMIGALGACFGRVVTLDSPRARQPPGSFNWAATLWHELAHVITLQMSAQRVPRWLTEGLSVYEERRARDSWGREAEYQFVDALAAGKTFPLTELNGGFSDPRRITLAYHQASLVVEHLVARIGMEGIGRMLRAYAEGADDDGALQKAAGLGLAELQQSYDAFVDARFGAQRRALAAVEGLDQALASGEIERLVELAATHHDNFRVQMALGTARLGRKELPLARAAFEQAARLVPAATGADGPKAMLARVAEAAGDAESRRGRLAEAVAEHHTALDLARELLAAARTDNDRARMRLALERIAEVDPFDTSAHSLLGRLALADGDTATALQAFRRALVAGPADPVAAHTDLAEALLAAGDTAEAKQQAMAALEMAPRYERAQDVLLAVVDGPLRRKE